MSIFPIGGANAAGSVSTQEKMFRRKKRGRWCGIRFMFYLERKDEEGDWVFTNWGFLTIPIRRVANE